MQKTVSIRLALTIVCILALMPIAKLRAQEGEDTKPSTAAAPQPHPKANHAYRVDFLISELDGGKAINSRKYVMDLKSGSHHMMQIDARVPIAVGPEGNVQFEYMDVGTTLNCMLTEEGDLVGMDTTADFSSFSSADEQPAPQSVARSRPIRRHVSISGSTFVVLGKPVLIGAVDDPNSTRQFQLEATVTKLR